MKKYLLSTVAVLVVGLMGLLLPFGTVQANPKGAPEGLKLAFKFNYIAVPPGTNVGCGQGHRVITERGATGHIVFELDTSASGFSVEDCETESVDGDYAWIVGDEADTYLVFVVLHGPNTSDNTLSICRDKIVDITDIEGSHTHACLLGELGGATLLSRTGTDRITFTKKLFADDSEGELWHLEIGTDYRIAEIRFYRDP